MHPIYNVWLVTEECNQMRDYLSFLEQSISDFKKKLENRYSIDELEKISELDDDSTENLE